MDIISVSKLRITDAISLEGLKKDMEAHGLKPYEAIRNALKEYYRNNTSTTNNETNERLRKIEAQNRLIIKKIFNANQDEYHELIDKTK